MKILSRNSTLNRALVHVLNSERMEAGMAHPEDKAAIIADARTVRRSLRFHFRRLKNAERLARHTVGRYGIRPRS